MDLVYSFAYITYAGITAWVTVLWMKGITDAKHTRTWIYIILALTAGTALTDYLSGGTTTALDGVLRCQKIRDHFHECVGWPILIDPVAKFTNGLVEYLGSFLIIPAYAAPLLGGLYIHKKMHENLTTTHFDIIKAFFTGVMVFGFLTNLDFIITEFTDIIGNITTSPGTVDQGKQVLSRWIEVIEKYVEFAADDSGWFYLPAIFLLIFCGILFVIINVGSILIIIGRVFLLATVPLSLFQGLLQKNADYWPAVQQVLLYAVVKFLNSIFWTIVAIFPLIEVPIDTDDGITITGKTLGMFFCQIALGFILGLYYYFTCKAIWPSIRKSIERFRP